MQLACIVAAFIGAATAAPSAPLNLTCETYTEPLNVDNAAPRFGWRLATGEAQGAYRITVVASSSGTTVWDSGAVASNRTYQVPYAGAALISDETYVWSVTVQPPTGGAFSPASSSEFSTGLLTPADWTGGWLGGTDRLRGAFTLPAGAVTRARLFIAAVGCYELSVNGIVITAGTAINPGFSTVYSARLLYQVWDVSAALRAGGPNAVGIQLGQCKYGYLGEYTTNASCPPTAASCNRALLQLNARVSGARVSFATTVAGGAWLAGPTPLVNTRPFPLFNGEDYDGRLDEPGWDTPAFQPPGGDWAPAVAMPPPAAVLSAHTMPPIGVFEARPIVRVEQPLPGTFVLDAGVNSAGWCELAVPGPLPAGAVVSVTYGEQRAADGTVQIQFPCPAACCLDGGNCANQHYTHAARGGLAVERARPRLSYAAFRWLQVEGWPAGAPPPGPDSVACVSISSLLAPTGALVFNSSSLNTLQAGIVRTQRAALQSIPVDCPHREKRGWMADAHVTAAEASLNLDTQGFYENWLRTMADTIDVGCGGVQPDAPCPLWHPAAEGSVDANVSVAVAAAGAGAASPPRPNCFICCWARDGFGCTFYGTNTSGALSDVTPFDKNGYGSMPGNLAWTAAFFVVAEVLLSQFGDVQGLATVYPQAKAHLAWYNAIAVNHSASGLLYLEEYGDWNAIGATDKLWVANAYYVHCASVMAEVAAATGHGADALAFLALAAFLTDELPAAFAKPAPGGGGSLLWDTGSQGAQAIPLALGVAAASNVTAGAIAALLAAVAAAGTHPTTGTIGTRHLLDALTAVGRSDVALDLALQPAHPGWLYMLQSQAAVGTLWESWKGVDGGSSMSHVMFGGGPGEWLWTTGLGLRFRHRPAAATAAAADADGDHEEEEAAAAACVASLGLGRDPVRLAGLRSRADACAVADVVARGRAARAAGAHAADVYALPAIAAAVSAATSAAAAAAAAPAWVPEVALVLDAHALLRLGAAAGTLETRAGALAARWGAVVRGADAAADAAPQQPPLVDAVTVRLELPHATAGAIFLPAASVARSGTVLSLRISAAIADGVTAGGNATAAAGHLLRFELQQAAGAGEGAEGAGHASLCHLPRARPGASSSSESLVQVHCATGVDALELRSAATEGAHYTALRFPGGAARTVDLCVESGAAAAAAKGRAVAACFA